MAIPIPILIIDDDPTSLYELELALGGTGYPLVSACDGDVDIILPLLEERHVQLIVSDVSMPTPGTVLVRNLRGCGVGIPIILRSADEKYRREALESGANCFMSKRCGNAELRSVVKALLSKGQ